MLCSDGLSPMDVLHIQHIYNFGGKLDFVNCGPKNVYLGLIQSFSDMSDKWWDAKDGSQEKDDYFSAMNLDN